MIKTERAISKGGRYMKNFLCIAVAYLIFLAGYSQSGMVMNLTSQLQDDLPDTAVFVSGMGCSDPDCMDASHHHDCPPDCGDYEHYHNCTLDCAETSHHHSSASGVNESGQHHTEQHHGGNHH